MEGLNQFSVILLEIVNAKMSNNKEQLFEKIYEAIKSIFKQDLINSKPVELSPVIQLLIQFYQEREEYEKCHMLNLIGYEVYNTITI